MQEALSQKLMKQAKKDAEREEDPSCEACIQIFWSGQVVTICENSWCFELSSQYFYRIRGGNFSKRGFIRLGEVWLAKWMAKHFAYQRSQFHPLDGNHRHSWKLYGICMGPQNGSKWMLNLRFHWRCGEESQSDWTFSRFSTGRLLTLKGLCGPKVPGG